MPFIVTTGEYSDYRIVAVFETEAEALEFTGGKENTTATPEEWDFGVPETEEYFRKTWIVMINLSDGNLQTESYSDQVRWEQHPRDWSQGYAFHYPKNDLTEHIRSQSYSVGRSTVSREHALKVAAEARQAYLREKGPA